MSTANGMDRDEILALAGSVETRLRSFRMLVRSWSDPEGRSTAALRMKSSGGPHEPPERGRIGLGAPRVDFTGVRYEYPDRAAEWDSSPDRFPGSEWGGKDPFERFPPAVPVSIPNPGHPAPADSRTPDIGPSSQGNVLPDFRDLFAAETTLEVIDPSDVLYALEFEIVGTRRFLRREAIHLHGVVGRPEDVGIHLTAADSYDDLLDAEVGILLRHACLVDGVEFEVTEVTHLELTTFSPPLSPPW